MIEGPFTLGTAQLGLPYGLGAAKGGLDVATVADILDGARAANIAWLDTAHAYGDAEARIGAWSGSHAHRFRLVSKLPSLADVADNEAPAAARAAFEESRARLGAARIDIYLTHRAADLRRPQIASWLREAQAKGRIGAFGASAYTAEDARAALDVEGIGALQLPVSVVSAGILDSDVLQRAAAQGVTVFARSVFLQGALLIAGEGLPSHLRDLAPVNTALGALAREAGVALPALLMAAVRQRAGVSSLVLGVDSRAQLAELAALAEGPALPAALCAEAFRLGRNVRPELADPRFWPKGEGTG